MSSLYGKNKKKRALKFLIISFILTFPTYSNRVQYLSPAYKKDSNQAIVKDKIDPQLLKLVNSNDEDQYLPIIIFYNSNDESLKKELEEDSNGLIYNYNLIPATSMSLSINKIHSIAKSPSVKKIYLDKKVFPLSFEKDKKNKEFRGSSFFNIPYTPLVNRSVSQIGAPYLWDLNLNGSGVVVAVLDTGIDKSHPDLNDIDDNPSTTDDKVIYEKSFIDLDYNGIPDENDDDLVGHGTHVAGIISGTGEASSYQFRGVAPGSKLMNVKVLTTYGGFDSWIIKGIEYATYGPDRLKNTGDEADIISMSLGGSGFIDEPIIQAVEGAWDLNKTVVIAAGNSGDDFFTLDSPGLSAKAITVGAVNSFDQVADFSSRGPSPDLRMGIDICAPGVDIISTRANISGSSPIEGNYTSKSGTSMATPFVAGAIALLLQSNPTLMPTTIKTALMISAVDLGVSSYIQGAGRLDINAAYNLINKIPQGGTTEIRRSDIIDTLEIDTNELFGEIDAPFYSDYFCDWHKNNTRWRAYNDLYETFFAIRYNSSLGQKFYLSTDLIEDYPRELRWLVQNSTHNIATESMKTPDGILKIEIFYEIYTTSKWLRVSFNITSLDTQDVKDVNFYYYMDPDIYGYSALDDEPDESDDAEFIQSINALVANDTYYDDIINPIYGYYPNNFLGFSSMNQSIAIDINSYSNAYSNLVNNTLTNNTSYHGDVALVQQLLNLTISPINYTFIPIILAFGNNKTNFIENVNNAKNTPFFNFNKPDICINTLSISNPIYNGTETYLNISVVNAGFSNSSKLNVSTYINNVEFNKTEINELSPNEEKLIKIPITLDNPGSYNLTIIADFYSTEFEDSYRNNKLVRNIKVITPYLVTFFPYSPLDNPLNLKYAGQFLYWNCCISQGENFSNLKLNKTGNGKNFVSFDDNPTSIDDVSINAGIDQYYINISIYIPRQNLGSYQLKLQLLNSSDILYEIPIEFEIFENLPAQLIIVNSTVDDGGLEDDDGVVEGEEDGEASLCIKSINASQYTYLYEPFLIVSSKNDSSINILNYRVLFEEYSLSPNETSWNDDFYSLVFSVAYNYSNLYVNFNSMIFAKIGYSSQEYIPYFHQMFNFSIQQRIPGTPKLELDSIEYTDIDSCDYNGIVDPGEIGAFGVNLRNVGDGSALQIFNTNFSCLDSRVTIPKPYYEWQFFIFIFIIPTIHIQWNGIDPGDTSESYSGLLVFNLSSSIPRGTTLTFELEIEYCNITGDTFKESFQFSYTIPLISDGGNGDDDEDNGEDDMFIILLIVTVSSIGGITAIVVIIFIKKRKSNILRTDIN